MTRYVKNMQKLRAVFEAVPDHLLEQLKGAMEFGAVNAPDELPYGQLLELINEQIEHRSQPEPLLLKPEQEVQLDQDLPPISGYDVRSVEPLLLTDPIEEVPAAFPDDLEYEFPRNAMHAFFSPLSGVIVEPPEYELRVEGCICSTSLPAIWRLLNEEESGVGIRDAWLQAEARHEKREPDFYRAIALKMHLAARYTIDRILRQSRENPALRRSLMNRLGGKVILSDLQELQSLLPVAMPFQSAYTRIKSLLGQVEEEGWDQVSALISKCTDETPSLSGYLQLSVVATIEKSWVALGLQERLSQECAPEEQGYNLIAEHYVSDVEAHADWVLDFLGKEIIAGKTVGDLEMLAQKLNGASHYAAVSHSLERSIKEIKGRFVRRYLKAIDVSSAAIKAALPMQGVGAEGGEVNVRWLLDDPEYSRKSRLAQDALDFLSKTEEVAFFLGEEDALQEAVHHVEGDLLRFRDQLEIQIRNLEGDERFEALRLADHVSELIGLILGEESKREASSLFSEASVA